MNYIPWYYSIAIVWSTQNRCRQMLQTTPN
jgi:hypothetical protein